MPNCVVRYEVVSAWGLGALITPAVVVDTGAVKSHAAIVAREFGISCVVGSKTGSRVLRTGHLIEVDGTSGRVRRVE